MPLICHHNNTMAASALLLALAGAFCNASAAVPGYDDFSGGGIDRSKWSETESWRYVDSKGRLNLGRGVLGNSSSNSGVTVDNFNLSMLSAEPTKSLKATITVTEVSVDELCPANPSPSYVRARLIGAYFNTRAGGPLPNDRTGDVLAQIRIGRASNASTPAEVLQVQGLVTLCTTADCGSSQVLGSIVELGSVNLGTAVKAQIDWDKKNNRFQFTRDGTTSGQVSYADADNTPPAQMFNNVSLRSEVANCASSPRVKAGISALFDNIGLAR